MNSSTAEENLRVIRGLMERAMIYRAISFPAAGFAGALALMVGGCMAFLKQDMSFKIVWLSVLAICTAVNFYFLFHEARRRAESFLSTGMLLALKCTGPVLLFCGLLTACFGNNGIFSLYLVILWCIAYGLLLLSTQTFAPMSLVWLGWVFFFTGIALMIVVPLYLDFARQFGYVSFAYLLMACTFGLYHLVYAGIGWALKSKASWNVGF